MLGDSFVEVEGRPGGRPSSVPTRELGHIPTVKIMELVRAHFREDEIAEWIERERHSHPADGGDDDQHFWEAMAVEFGCRELLARYWLSLEGCSHGSNTLISI